MSTAQNIFPSQQQTNYKTIEVINGYSPYQSLVDINRMKLKTIEANYFQNEYKNILNAKQRQKQLEKIQKQKDRHLVEAKKAAHQQEIQQQFEKKKNEKAYLSTDYQNTIDYQQQKNKYEKNMNKFVQNQVLSSPNWIRNAESQRQANIRKKMYYNGVLEEHVKLQEQRKMQQQLSNKFYQQKIRRQADQMLQKEYHEMQAKHRTKSMFEERQNEILGLGSQQPNLQDSRSYLQKKRQLKMTQREIYRQGLQAQYEKEQQGKTQRKRDFSQNKQEFNPRYNPITNPIPFVYKNPNVLRMFGQPN